MNVLTLLGGGLLGLGVLGSLHAGTNNFYVPTFRGEPGAQAGYWEDFTIPFGSIGNLPNFGTGINAMLTQTAPGAIITGGAAGNIYNMQNASAFTVNYSSSLPVRTVVLQTRTIGTELAYDSIRLNYGFEGGSLPADRVELDRSPFGGGGGPQGFFVSSAWEWDLSSLNVGTFSITFNAAEPSLSFDAMTLDTQLVPEPSTWALLGMGGFAVLFASRYRRHHTTGR
ncbi:MAG TPA: PEP-CTERM sorting domain-containing protein [Verrucomicrobiota bacterium]|nr:hypothetical protein [Verrucomicrobiales bacterium]HRI11639.1 PEP-CTERM sorting domain-containing protein [Verrucomicrobiota bacterium]